MFTTKKERANTRLFVLVTREAICVYLRETKHKEKRFENLLFFIKKKMKKGF